ncbi:MAG: GNAT family N-acetyltransferase [Solirubrobacterales bacterium]|nr:GNAT family N-acetyltransferase [Solirubrobacterales bacterium]
MRLIPLTHPIPPGITADRFVMRLITVSDLVRDYDAVMSNVEHLRQRFPYWGWPDPAMTMEDDLVDLGWHQKEAKLRRSFNYAVLTPDERRLLGCLYVDPPEKRGAEAEVCLWIRADQDVDGLEADLEAAVREWLAAEWPFKTICWPGREISWEEWSELPDV